MGNGTERWAAGVTYEDFMGRWSRQLAPKFVSQMSVPAGAHWLDVGCGTGALTEAICNSGHPASVIGCDPSEPFIQYARKHHSDKRTSFVVAGVGELPTHPSGFGCVTSLLALNFFPRPEFAIEEMRSVAASGGVVSACVWDYAGRMEVLRYFWDVVVELDPKAQELDEGRRFPVCQPDVLTELLRTAGLSDVRCDPIEITAQFASFDEYWRPFLGGTGPAPTYIATLETERRTALTRALDHAIPKQPGGKIVLVARAWAVRGLVA